MIASVLKIAMRALARNKARSDRKSTRLNSSHRDLHSFPTRHSADLRTNWYRHNMRHDRRSYDRLGTQDRHARTGAQQSSFRSEEHTSELQSPRSTLFPYTTLCRSEDQLVPAQYETRQEEL